MNSANNGSAKHLIEQLKASSFYQACQNAFRDGTGLPLILQSADEPPFNPCHASKNQNAFCKLINASDTPCGQCVAMQNTLFARSQEKASTRTCFAGLMESAVPLRLGHCTVGFLRTGQVFTAPLTPKQLKSAIDALRATGLPEEALKRALQQYRQTPEFKPERYSGTITLLSVISLQLTEFLNRLLLESKSNEPEIVRKAKSIITSQLDKKLTLEDVSHEIHVSVFYFCKVFKQATGMTFTEYVNRQRIELAKRELKKTDRAVTEIAYAVGFQSLSHFNRCFLKFAGESPRQYRDCSHERVPRNLLVS